MKAFAVSDASGGPLWGPPTICLPVFMRNVSPVICFLSFESRRQSLRERQWGPLPPRHRRRGAPFFPDYRICGARKTPDDVSIRRGASISQGPPPLKNMGGPQREGPLMFQCGTSHSVGGLQGDAPKGPLLQYLIKGPPCGRYSYVSLGRPLGDPYWGGPRRGSPRRPPKVYKAGVWGPPRGRSHGQLRCRQGGPLLLSARPDGRAPHGPPPLCASVRGEKTRDEACCSRSLIRLPTITPKRKPTETETAAAAAAAGSGG